MAPRTNMEEPEMNILTQKTIGPDHLEHITTAGGSSTLPKKLATTFI
jgi:hypothetical protein